MRVLIACEFSGVVRRAWREAGHDAWSCDILPAEDSSPHHLQMDVRHALTGNMYFTPMGSVTVPWDLMIAHPPCTHLSLAGARWFYDKRFPNKADDQKTAITFFQTLQSAPIERICIENPQPLGRVMQGVGRYDQKFQPWSFKDDETKGICLWLKNLPPLIRWVTKKPDNVKARVWRMPPGPERQKERSRFFPGTAKAMAEQWGMYGN